MDKLTKERKRTSTKQKQTEVQVPQRGFKEAFILDDLESDDEEQSRLVLGSRFLVTLLSLVFSLPLSVFFFLLTADTSRNEALSPSFSEG